MVISLNSLGIIYRGIIFLFKKIVSFSIMTLQGGLVFSFTWETNLVIK